MLVLLRRLIMRLRQCLEYRALDDMVIGNWRIGKDLEGSG
jgi:hypothetical protein